MSSALLLEPSDAIVAMIDVQENHFHTIPDGAACLHRLVHFLQAVRALRLPVLWTEHYPRGFGPTLEPVRQALQGIEPISKTSFGCFGEPSFVEAVSQAKRNTLVLTGSETPICVLQTGLQALEQGMDVVVVADCVAARYELDHEIALERLAAAGAVLTTWESLVYEWMRHAKHPDFKQVLAVVKRAGE